jgi:DNA polymerase III delta subunit
VLRGRYYLIGAKRETSKGKDATEFASRIKALDSLPPALLVIAPESVRRRRSLEVVYSRIAELSGCSKTEIKPRSLNASQLSVQDVVSLKNDLSNLSLFTAAQVVTVHDVENLKGTLTKNLLECSSQIAPGACLVLAAGKLAANSVLRKHFMATNQLYELRPLSSQELKQWTAEELKRCDLLSSDSLLVETIIASAHDSLDAIAQMAERMALYLTEKKATTEDFVRLFPQSPDPRDYELLAALERRDRLKAEVLVSHLLHSGKNPFFLLSYLFRSFSQYIVIHSLLLKKMGPSEIALHLGMPQWLLEKNVGAARGRSLERLRHDLKAILHADSLLKNYSLGPEGIFSKLVSELAA